MVWSPTNSQKLSQPAVVDYTYLKKNGFSNRSSAFFNTYCRCPTIVQQSFRSFPHISALFCFQAGKRVGKALHAPLMKLLEQEESLGKKRQKVGFFGWDCYKCTWKFSNKMLKLISLLRCHYWVLETTFYLLLYYDSVEHLRDNSSHQ